MIFLIQTVFLSFREIIKMDTYNKTEGVKSMLMVTSMSSLSLRDYLRVLKYKSNGSVGLSVLVFIAHKISCYFLRGNVFYLCLFWEDKTCKIKFCRHKDVSLHLT